MLILSSLLVTQIGCSSNESELLTKTNGTQALVNEGAISTKSAVTEFDELDPFASDIDSKISEIDKDYMDKTGESPILFSFFSGNGCMRDVCKIWIQVVKSRQLAYLFIDGINVNTWKVSTGTQGRDTPNFDRHPNGRIYDSYTSSKFPGGDYNGLGNMPYAIFIEGGFAIHGTAISNWPKLGTKASHGCVRVHPDNAKYFNRLVRQYGINQTWITIQN